MQLIPLSLFGLITGQNCQNREDDLLIITKVFLMAISTGCQAPPAREQRGQQTYLSIKNNF